MPAPDDTAALKEALIAAVMWWEGIKIISETYSRGITFDPGNEPSWFKQARLALARGDTNE